MGKMFINDTFFINDRFNFMCDEYTMALVATWYGKAYEMMFADTLNIELDGERDFLLREKIQNNSRYMHKWLRKYHGIEVSECMAIHGNELISVITAEISMGNPVWIWVDLESITSIHEIDKMAKSNNIIVIVGIESEEEKVYFRTIFGRDRYLDVLEMSFVELQLSTKEIRTFKNVESTVFIDGFKEALIENTINGEWRGCLKKISEFADYIENDFDFSMYLDEYEKTDLRDVPLIYNMAELYRSRALFSICLSYLGLIQKLISLQKLADEFIVLAGRFYSIRGMILKYFFRKHMSKDDQFNIANLFRKIIALEKQLLATLERL